MLATHVRANQKDDSVTTLQVARAFVASRCLGEGRFKLVESQKGNLLFTVVRNQGEWICPLLIRPRRQRIKVIYCYNAGINGSLITSASETFKTSSCEDVAEFEGAEFSRGLRTPGPL